MKTAGKTTTIAGETYSSLRSMILSGELRPGLRMRTAELQDRFDVSLSTVREALSQLSSEGLVIAEAHRGYTVAPISADDLRDLTRVRIEVEKLCLTWAIEQGDVEWESRVISASHRLSKTFRAVGGTLASQGWTLAHDEFHSALVSACGSSRLLQIRQSLYEQSERYRKLERTLGRRRNPDLEHAKIVDATLARDAPRAIRLMSAHITLTADNILSAMTANAPAVRPFKLSSRQKIGKQVRRHAAAAAAVTRR
jgi:DNA-binding GntR family transcriptional regulator